MSVGARCAVAEASALGGRAGAGVPVLGAGVVGVTCGALLCPVGGAIGSVCMPMVSPSVGTWTVYVGASGASGAGVVFVGGSRTSSSIKRAPSSSSSPIC